jgi:hypothetical protein
VGNNRNNRRPVPVDRVAHTRRVAESPKDLVDEARADEFHDDKTDGQARRIIARAETLNAMKRG